MPFNPSIGGGAPPQRPPAAPARQPSPQAGALFQNIGARNAPGGAVRRRPRGPRTQGMPGLQRRGVPGPDPRLAAPAQAPGPWGMSEPPMSPAMARLLGNGGYGRG